MSDTDHGPRIPARMRRGKREGPRVPGSSYLKDKRPVSLTADAMEADILKCSRGLYCLPVKNVARLLHSSRQHVSALIHAGEIRGYYHGGRIMVPLSSVWEWQEKAMARFQIDRIEITRRLMDHVGDALREGREGVHAGKHAVRSIAAARAKFLAQLEAGITPDGPDGEPPA